MTAGAGIHNERLADEMSKPPEERDAAVVNQSQEEYVASKIEELRKAAAVFGITDIRSLDFPDAPFRLESNLEAVDRVRDVILEVRPHVMIADSPFLKGTHGLGSTMWDDHREAGKCAIEARQRAAAARFGDERAPHTIAAVYFPGVYFQQEQWDFAVDTSDWYEQRVEAEATFVSQGHTPEFARRRIQVGPGHVGWASGTSYAEAFVREKPELLTEITVAESALLRSEESGVVHLQRLAGERPKS
jgi:LmbE family N-acetylglucosaminyl deacetylase